LKQTQKQTPATSSTAAVTPSTIFQALSDFSLKIQIPRSLTEVLYITNNVWYCSIGIPQL